MVTFPFKNGVWGRPAMQSRDHKAGAATFQVKREGTVPNLLKPHTERGAQTGVAEYDRTRLALSISCCNPPSPSLCENTVLCLLILFRPPTGTEFPQPPPSPPNPPARPHLPEQIPSTLLRFSSVINSVVINKDVQTVVLHNYLLISQEMPS